MGRPTTCTPETVTQIAEALEGGVSITDACALAGITKRTYHNWIERGEAGEEPFSQFLQCARAARAKGRAKCLKVIMDAVPSKLARGGVVPGAIGPQELGAP